MPRSIQNFGKFLACALVAMGTMAGGYTQALSSTNFYIVAHADDWQLFMNPNAYYDVQDQNSKTVFVYLTAGDNGREDATLGGPLDSFYRARENGANYAVRFMADVIGKPREAPLSSEIVIRGHTLHKVIYKNTVSYFLRLPDGNSDGSGFANTGSWSLARFRTAGIPAKAVDGSAFYADWKDLVETIRQLITGEMTGAPEAWINVSESDTRLNSITHSDHVNTSLLVQEAVSGIKCVNRVFYVDYTTASKPRTLSPEDQEIQSGVFAVTVMGVSQFGYPSSWDPIHRSVLGRQYVRVDRGQNCGSHSR
jgi:hypothetical protein